MAQTIVPEEQKRATDLDDLRNSIWPTKNRVVFLEGQSDSGDGLENLYWWDSSGNANDSDPPVSVASEISRFGDGGSDEGLWRRTFSPTSQVTTDSVPEGDDNLYYTSDRAKNEFEAGGDLTYTKYLPAGFNISAGNLITSFDVSSEEDNFSGSVAFNTGGTKMFVVGSSNDTVYEYNLNVGFDVSTASYSGTSFDTSPEAANPTGLTFSDSGDKMFVTDLFNESVFEYVLGTNFDVATASYSGESFGFEAQTNYSPSGVTFNSGGTKMFIVSRERDLVFEYNLSNGFDISTVSYSGTSFDVSSEKDFPNEVLFNGDGTEMFVLGRYGSRVHEYNLNAGYDISTASYSGTSLDVSSEESSPSGAKFSSDGTKLFIIGDSDKSVYEYDTSRTNNRSRFSIDVSEIDDLLSNSTTDDLSEGSTNQYFTGERAQDAVASSLVGTGDVQISHDDAANEISIDFTGASGSIGIEDNGSEVVSGATSVNFSKALSVSDGGGDTAIVGLDGDFSKAAFSGDGAKKEFQIPHGLSQKPAYWIVNATSEDGSGISHVAANGTSIIVEYDTPPPSGTENINLNWFALMSANSAPTWTKSEDYIIPESEF